MKIKLHSTPPTEEGQFIVSRNGTTSDLQLRTTFFVSKELWVYGSRFGVLSEGNYPVHSPKCQGWRWSRKLKVHL